MPTRRHRGPSRPRGCRRSSSQRARRRLALRSGSRIPCTELPVGQLQRHKTPPAPSAAPLSLVLFRSGELKGKRLPIKVPVVNIGRGDYNDVVIADPSVSTMHAKLQRREADLDSHRSRIHQRHLCGGRAAQRRAPLSPGSTIRFGDVTALFEPLDDKVAGERAGQHPLMEQLEPDRLLQPVHRSRRPKGRRPQPRAPAADSHRHTAPQGLRPRSWWWAADPGGNPGLPAVESDGASCTLPAPLAPTLASSVRAMKTTT